MVNPVLEDLHIGELFAIADAISDKSRIIEAIGPFALPKWSLTELHQAPHISPASSHQISLGSIPDIGNIEGLRQDPITHG